MRRDDNPPRAVCVHGAGGGGWEWTIWARVLAARGWNVLAPDLQAAAAGIAGTTFDDYRGQACEWCASPPPDLLVGASLGGLLALSVAAEVQPRALVLVNPLPPRGPASLPARVPYPAVVSWGSTRSLAGTRRALPDADDATCLAAFRRWRDESGVVLNAAIAGIDIEPPRCPMLILASENDDDMPFAHSQLLARSLHADFELLPRASHVGPLLGRSAARIAQRVADWAESRFTQQNTR